MLQNKCSTLSLLSPAKNKLVFPDCNNQHGTKHRIQFKLSTNIRHYSISRVLCGQHKIDDDESVKNTAGPYPQHAAEVLHANSDYIDGEDVASGVHFEGTQGELCKGTQYASREEVIAITEQQQVEGADVVRGTGGEHVANYPKQNAREPTSVEPIEKHGRWKIDDDESAKNTAGPYPQHAAEVLHANSDYIDGEDVASGVHFEGTQGELCKGTQYADREDTGGKSIGTKDKDTKAGKTVQK